MMGKKRYLITMECFIFSCIFLLIFCTGLSASDNVKTDIEFTFTDGTHLNVDVTADVYEITLPANGVTYTKSEIQTLSTSNPEMMGAIKISIKGLVLDQLYESFPDSKIVSLQELPTYTSGEFVDSYRLSFLPSFFSLNESVDIDALVDGFMDCGAYVNYTFTLKSYPGWNQSYVFTIPRPLNYNQITGEGEVQQNAKQTQIIWHVKTEGEANEKDAQITLLDTDPTSPFSENESMHIQCILDCMHSEKPVLTLQFQGFSTMITSYEMLPDFISNVISLPADAMRLSVLQNLTSWNVIKNRTFDPAYSKVKPVIENSSFNQTISPSFSWVNNTTFSAKEPFNTTHMDTTPPLKANYSDDSIHFTICSISSRAFFGLINAGAQANITKNDVNIGDNLDAQPYPYNGTFLLPDHVLLDTVRVFNWNQTNPINGSFSSTNAPHYAHYDISTYFEIDVKNTDLNLLSFFTGKTELTMGLSLKETQKRNISEKPFHFSLPNKIMLPYLNSDAFRLCVEEHVFTEAEINQFTKYQKGLFQSRSKTLFPLIKGKARFDTSSFDESLIWDGNISFMDKNDPVIISSSMQTAFPLLFEFSILPPSVSIQTLNISFSGIEDQDVTYLMIFPKGISIDVSDTLDRAEIKQFSEGQKGVSISFNATEGGKVDTMLISMHPSGLYILGMFVPCIISVLITVILFVLVYIIRKKRKMMPPLQKETPAQDFEEEDYYVPPPPPSKRK